MPILLKIFLVLMTPLMMVEGAVVGAVQEPVSVWKEQHQSFKDLKDAEDNLERLAKQMKEQVDTPLP
jgi:hypothetical protein